jgi:hypothetical protein
MIEVKLGIRWMHTFTKLPMHVPKINAIIPAKPVSGIFNLLSLYPCVFDILCGLVPNQPMHFSFAPGGLQGFSKE